MSMSAIVMRAGVVVLLGGLSAANAAMGATALSRQEAGSAAPELATTAGGLATEQANNVRTSGGVGTHGSELGVGAAAYWTTERMAAATPAATQLPAHQQLPETGIGTLGTDQLPTVVADTTPRNPTHQVLSDPTTARYGDAAGQSVTMSAKNGKIFFTNATTGTDYMCSGAAVNSSSKRLVVTAAHCIFDPQEDKLHANVVFVPKYHHGAEPYGKFAAKRAFIFADYKKYGNTAKGWRSDVAFFSTHPDSSGKTVVERVGGHGVRTNGSGQFNAHVFGYPTNRQRGEAMVACLQQTRKAQVAAVSFVSVAGCGFGSGASGGPWLADYDNSRGSGYVQSVTSFGPASQTATSPLYGPLFDWRVSKLFAQANQQG